MDNETEVSPEEMQTRIRKAAQAIKDCNCMLITSGAGLGVDSGLPDFRGPEGFWRAYPPMQKLGLRFEQMSNPQWFKKDPNLAWGFWGHRISLYQSAVPHKGYEIMINWLNKTKYKSFTFTSNVDCQWIKAGVNPDLFEECHGSIGYLQCTERCTKDLWPTDIQVNFNPTTFQASDPLPKCKFCPRLARPNVLMFGDMGWNHKRNNVQGQNFLDWQEYALNLPDLNMVIIEIGAGKAVSTVRSTSERMAKQFEATFIRINPRDFDFEYPGSYNGIGLPLGGKDGLVQIEQVLNTL